MYALEQCVKVEINLETHMTYATRAFLVKEKPEMSNNIDQFTITQESKDFDISLYDQYHCYEKHYSANSSVHSLIPPETSPNISRFTITKE
ncbi:36235_t:CDS:2, partial [Gigaspora margarita]